MRGLLKRSRSYSFIVLFFFLLLSGKMSCCSLLYRVSCIAYLVSAALFFFVLSLPLAPRSFTRNFRLTRLLLILAGLYVRVCTLIAHVVIVVVVYYTCVSFRYSFKYFFTFIDIVHVNRSNSIKFASNCCSFKLKLLTFSSYLCHFQFSFVL